MYIPTHTAPPDVQVHPSIAEANVGTQVILYCSDGGFIPEEFEWQFEGEKLESGGNVLVRQTGELVLTNVQVGLSRHHCHFTHVLYYTLLWQDI